MESFVVSNLLVLLLFASGVGIGIFVRRNRIWREAARELWRRRPWALLVVGLYIAIATLDSIAWVGGEQAGDDVVSASEAKSIVDRWFLGTQERSYSAPLATVDLYDGLDLEHPGTHLLGTDILGRDVVYMTLKGARVALLIGGLTSLIAIPLALLFGVSAGYFGGLIDDLVFFVMSTLSSMPGLLLLIALIMVMGRSTLSVCLALAITGWVGFCRLTRGDLPNLSHLIVITFVLTFSGLVLSEAVLSWLGIGVDGSWGQMIDQARDELSRDPAIWWNLTAAGSALFVLILAINFVGDAIRDIFDPRTLREDL
jgi:peptide/nickel transport system permease protein